MTCGSTTHFLVGGVLTSFRNQGRAVLTFGRNSVLLTRVHGSACGGNGPAPCFVARAWDPVTKAWQYVEGGRE